MALFIATRQTFLPVPPPTAIVQPSSVLDSSICSECWWNVRTLLCVYLHFIYLHLFNW